VTSIPRTQFEQIERIATVIEVGTPLKRDGQLYQLGGNGSIHHRRFRFALPSSEYDEGQIPQPGGQLDVTDSVEIIVSHDRTTEAQADGTPTPHDDAWRVASEDVAAMLCALIQSPLGQQMRINGGGSTPEIVGAFIQQRVRLQYRYYLTIPEAP
jgi:hypothetical protein